MDKYSLRGQVFQEIREDILKGKFKENEELREATLGKELGVSRTPVREALRQLELEVAEDNLRAQGLYRKMGFSEVARLPDALRRQDGTYRAIVYMRKVLE